MTTICAEIDAVVSAVERVKNDDTQRFPVAASPGDFARQGDVQIALLERVPTSVSKIVKHPREQLAPGNTQGSRHCLSSLDGIVIRELKSPNVYDGPIIEADRNFTVEHTEHGNWEFPPGCYAISYQRTEDSEGKQRRVQD